MTPSPPGPETWTISELSDRQHPVVETAPPTESTREIRDKLYTVYHHISKGHNSHGIYRQITQSKKCIASLTLPIHKLCASKTTAMMIIPHLCYLSPQLAEREHHAIEDLERNV